MNCSSTQHGQPQLCFTQESSNKFPCYPEGIVELPSLQSCPRGICLASLTEYGLVADVPEAQRRLAGGASRRSSIHYCHQPRQGRRKNASLRRVGLFLRPCRGGLHLPASSGGLRHRLSATAPSALPRHGKISRQTDTDRRFRLQHRQ